MSLSSTFIENLGQKVDYLALFGIDSWQIAIDSAETAKHLIK